MFIDEAAQALEAASWIAINKADRVVFAGDHFQLPPTVKCLEALNSGLDRTLMEHVAENKPGCVSLLTMQYRMNEKIMRFSSYFFYDGKLTVAPQVDSRDTGRFGMPMIWMRPVSNPHSRFTLATAESTGISASQQLTIHSLGPTG